MPLNANHSCMIYDTCIPRFLWTFAGILEIVRTLIMLLWQ